MPELPEVEVVRRGLEPAVTGATVSSLEVFDQRSLKRHDPTAGSFEELLVGQRMLAAVRRGKFLWLPLSGGRALVTHLGMSGQMLLREPGYDDGGLLRIRVALQLPAHGELWLNFVDQRIFGSMAVDTLVATPDGGAGGFAGAASGPWRDQIPSQVTHIARDPIDPEFSEDAFVAALSRTKTGIKRVLLNQRVVSGIGNIYADEALWAAGIHYEAPSSSLSATRVHDVVTAVRSVLEKALAEGGTSFDAQYVNVNGESGYFSHSLNVYGQQGKPCPRCGTPIVRKRFMNRGSHLCPNCQRPG